MNVPTVYYRMNHFRPKRPSFYILLFISQVPGLHLFDAIAYEEFIYRNSIGFNDFFDVKYRFDKYPAVAYLILVYLDGLVYILLEYLIVKYIGNVKFRIVQNCYYIKDKIQKAFYRPYLVCFTTKNFLNYFHLNLLI
ncbi:hypothetical protein RF11_04051 [Thelohanellus kitauei]|uniref:Uncharacterized protein n=1 Tax=Thelohanellus kitauei TaxID=669202 RepID=A0A0C2N5A8_THEKT|nr:hypothetical protein RF11_04051 [Thelohanellus kitauei]